MAMIEAHVGTRPFQAGRLLDEIRALGLRTPDSSARMIRQDRRRR